MKDGALNLPAPVPLPGRDMPMPFVLVSDDAFAASQNLMKPHSGKELSGLERVFTYRLSRSRRVVESAFGIMSARFRALRTAIRLDEKKTRQIASACCALHNYLIARKNSGYIGMNIADRWRKRQRYSRRVASGAGQPGHIFRSATESSVRVSGNQGRKRGVCRVFRPWGRFAVPVQ